MRNLALQFVKDSGAKLLDLVKYALRLEFRTDAGRINFLVLLFVFAIGFVAAAPAIIVDILKLFTGDDDEGGDLIVFAAVLSGTGLLCVGGLILDDQVRARIGSRSSSEGQALSVESHLPGPGWYLDAEDNSVERWFDGAEWSDYKRPR